MSVEFHPKGLDTWIYLLDESPIPVLAPTYVALKNQMGSASEWALSDAADIIAQDPIMTLHLIREANRVFKNKVAGSLTDVHHCVSLLGQDRVHGLIKQFKAMPGDPADSRETAYRAAVMQSIHAAAQVNAWHQVKKQSAVDKHSLAAQLAGMPAWCLWYFAHKEMGMIDTLQKQERIAKTEAEKAVLGCTTSAIVKALAERWQFPPVILQALDEQALPSAQFLAHVARDGYREKEPRIPNKDEAGNIVKTSSFIVALANWLAREAAIDWYSRQTRRVLAIVAAYLEVDIQTARNIAQTAAVGVSNQSAFLAVEMPAARLLLPPQPAIRRRINSAQLNTEVAKLANGQALRQTSRQQPENAAPSVNDQVMSHPVNRVIGFVDSAKEGVFKEHINLLLTKPHAFSNEHEVLRKSADVLRDVTSLERIVLFLFERQQKQLRGYLALGCDQYPAFKKMNIALTPANFFTQLIRKPQAVWVRPEKKSDIAALIPGVFKQVAQADEFFSASIFNQRQPVAVLYVDQGIATDKSLSESEFKITRTLANATSKYLIQSGKLARNS
ncbi:MAG: hypothetical protein CSA49_05195 [Gammaproteobacteria bacterium]|nr:MAG: hypothetical protein CSA49_05195 [Gammaproteobacteria bacterium]